VTWTYWRVSPRIWYEPWSDDARQLALYLLTCRHREAEGLFRLPRAYMRDDLKWSPERLAEGFDELLRAGFVEYDEGASVVLIVKALKYQSPANPNQEKHAIGKLEDLPETLLFAGLLRSAERYAEGFAKRLRERLPERFGNGLHAPALPTAPSPEEHCPPEDGSDVATGETDITPSTNGESFGVFWAMYPRKESRSRAAGLLKNMRKADQERALAACRHYATWAARHPNAELMLASTFLSKTGRRWEEWEQGPPPGRDRALARPGRAGDNGEGERAGEAGHYCTDFDDRGTQTTVWIPDA